MNESPVSTHSRQKFQMRFLHTADWHLGSRLSGHDRDDELFDQVRRVREIAAEKRAEVLLVAGDVFDNRRRLAELTKRLARILAPHIRDGMHVILASGNHDDREHFRMLHALLALEQGRSELVHIVQKPEVLHINGVQFGIVPYPSRELLEPHQPQVTGQTERQTVLSAAFAELIRATAAAFDPEKPAVLATHTTISGVKSASDRELTYDEDILLGSADFPLFPNLAYIALGHIHQPQQISHPIPCYYSGSIDRLNFGEKNDEKCVFLVDVPNDGQASVEKIVLDATPFYDLAIPAAEVESLPEKYPDFERAFFKFKIECASGDNPIMLQRRLREICPRCIDVQFSGEGLAPLMMNAPEESTDYRATALDYLREQFADDPDLPALQQRAEELILEVSDAAAKT